MTPTSPAGTFPDFLPAAAIALTEATSIELAQQMRQVDIETGNGDRAIPTAYACQGQGQPPLLLIHGFDSSLLEFRRLIPYLATEQQTWAVDLLGFGFTERPAEPALTSDAIRHHLYCFWQQQIQRPVVLVGASMGGAAALDFTLTYPDAVERLVLLDSAGLAAGPAMEKFMFPPLDRWATAFLKNPGVRRRISRQAYYDKSLVTPDAEVCAALHLQCLRWSEALAAFTKSGGYRLPAGALTQISAPTLVIWGRQDKILGTRDAEQFAHKISQAQLRWIDDCGHVPHLEKPSATATILQQWLS